MVVIKSENQCTVMVLHIPKTGGRTLINILKGLFGSDELFLNSDKVKIKLDDRVRKVEAAERWRISEEALANLTEEQKKSLKVVAGHMNFGRHTLLDQPTTYITLLRNPIERSLSHYYHILSMHNHYLCEAINNEKMSVADFIESGLSFLTDNGQVRMISGVGETIAHGECDESILELAKKNIAENFSVTGLTEEFEGFLQVLKKRFGWHINKYEKTNVLLNRPHSHEISNRELQVIERFNRQDLALYEYTSERFRKDFNR